MITFHPNTSNQLTPLDHHERLRKHLRLEREFLSSGHHKQRKAVLDQIVSYISSSKDWSGFRVQKLIANKLKIGLSTVKRHIRWFKDNGYIEVPLRQNDATGRLGANCYRVTDKLLNVLGLKREGKLVPLVKLQELWNTAKSNTAKTSKYARNF